MQDAEEGGSAGGEGHRRGTVPNLQKLKAELHMELDGH